MLVQGEKLAAFFANKAITQKAWKRPLSHERKLTSPVRTDFLVNTGEPTNLNYFTERWLRPLTLLASDKDKIKKFDEMREALNSL